MSNRPSVRAVSRTPPPAPVLDVAARRTPARHAVVALLERPLGIAFVATLGVLGAVVLGWAVGSITTILIYIVLALFVALGLDPAVRMLERRGIKRGGAIGVVFGVFALLALCVLVFVLPPVFAQIGQFVRTIPSSIAEVESSAWFTALSTDAQAVIAAGLDQFALAVSKPEVLAAIGGGALAIGLGIANAVSAGFIVVALTLYFLASLASMKQALYALSPARNRPRLTDMTERVTASVGSSLLGSVTLSAVNAAVVFALHVLIGLPYAALMASIAFVVTLIPLFGSVIFFVFASFIALFSNPTQALIFALCYLVYIQIESYVVSPRIMNRAISIPAALVLIGAMIGGALLGILGVLIALPVAATILLIIREVVVPKQDLKV